MKKIIEYLKKYYLYIILILVIIFLAISIILVVMLDQKETVQVPEVKLEQLEETKEQVKTKETVKIDIKGNIANPGVYELEQGTRVIDAINIAGGLLENSNTDLINLSQILTDEMIIIIYTNDQIEKYRQDSKQIEYVYVEVEKCPDQINDACINKQENNPSKEDNSKKENNSLININEASTSELMTLSGIGESKAKDIIEYRETNGKFKTTQDITNVKGIGTSIFEKIKDFITI